jgi:hypothetical protein
MEVAEPPVTSTDDLNAPPGQHGARNATKAFPAWARRHNTVLTGASACIAPILYLLFIDHDAVNSYFSDDWSVVPLVHAALHGHLTLTGLWSQHHESRIPIGNLIDVVFGFTDQLDLRAIIFFSAAVLVLSYIGLLALVRNYIGTRLTPLPVLIIGAIWFSLADVQNALWAFQVSWYLTVFFFVMMLTALLLPERHRPLWLAVAVALALAASLSTVQGFLCWIVGAICILWPGSPRRRRHEVAIWLGTMIVTIAVYLHGYRLSDGDICLARTQCTANFELHHPQTVLGFFFALIGNVIPGSTTGAIVLKVDDPGRFVLVGAVLFAASVLILVHSWRHRALSRHPPLPGLLIVFALLFDLTVVVGRGGTGVAGAVYDNRYLMANLILLTAIAIWALAHIPTRRLLLATGRRWRVVGICLIFSVFAIFVVVQVAESTTFGVTNGRSSSEGRIATARLFVNASPSCAAVHLLPFLSVPQPVLRDMVQDHLGEFGPTTYRRYREMGPTPSEITLVRTIDETITEKTGLKLGACFLPPIAPSSR